MSDVDNEWQCDDCGAVGDREVFPCLCDVVIWPTPVSRVVGKFAPYPTWPNILASNLATASALCRAWEGGYDVGVRFGVLGLKTNLTWYPGCGREAP